MVQAKPVDAEEIAAFLSENFRITEKATCTLPLERLRKGLSTNWIVVYAKKNGSIVGTIASRSLGTTQFHMISEKEQKMSKYPKTGYIDFFCVHPDFRKSGLGTLLLKHIDYYTNEIGRSIHFFQKEITPLLHVPPIWMGTYIVREVNHIGQNPHVTSGHFTKKLQRLRNDFELVFYTNEQSEDTKLYTYNCGDFKLYLAITNTYHTYNNSWLGEVLFYRVEVDGGGRDTIPRKNIAAAIEDVLETSEYRYILMDESIPHLKQMSWKKDAPYYLYAYNVNPRHFFTVKPEFWF